MRQNINVRTDYKILNTNYTNNYYSSKFYYA